MPFLPGKEPYKGGGKAAPLARHLVLMLMKQGPHSHILNLKVKVGVCRSGFGSRFHSKEPQNVSPSNRVSYI